MEGRHYRDGGFADDKRTLRPQKPLCFFSAQRQKVRNTDAVFQHAEVEGRGVQSAQPVRPFRFLVEHFKVQDRGSRALDAPIVIPDGGGERRTIPGGKEKPAKKIDNNAGAREGEHLRFSLLMSTCQGDDPEHCRQALQSICDNSVLPDDLVLVLDGSAPEPLIAAIASFSHRLPLRLVHLSENRGLGEALAVGLEHCRYNWVARFDADDICMPDRFERQLAFIAENPHVDAFSSPVEEFRESPGETNRLLKSVPCGSHALAVYARRRNPLNHMAVMFRKDRVLAAGNYQGEVVPLFRTVLQLC